MKIMKTGDKITIIPSIALEELRLKDLAGQHATLVEEDLLPKHIGWWVSLDEGEYLGEREWFIPLSSIVQD